MESERLVFLEAKPTLDNAPVALVGLPYDGTASYRKGARNGPVAIRRASDSLETYDPLLDDDLLVGECRVDAALAQLGLHAHGDAVGQQGAADLLLPARADYAVGREGAELWVVGRVGIGAREEANAPRPRVRPRVYAPACIRVCTRACLRFLISPAPARLARCKANFTFGPQGVRHGGCAWGRG